jgi:hypothetical protein
MKRNYNLLAKLLQSSGRAIDAGRVLFYFFEQWSFLN